MKYQVLHNSRCGKSREAVTFLEENKIDFEVKEYLKEPLTKDELKEIIKKLNIEPIALVRTSETEWKENFKGKDLSNDEIVDAMISFPKLIQRPVIISDKNAVVGRPLEVLEEFIKG